MSIKGKAYLMGAFEHPLRDAPDTSTPQLHGECALGALTGWRAARIHHEGLALPFVVSWGVVWFAAMTAVTQSSPGTPKLETPRPFDWIPWFPLVSGEPLNALEAMLTKLVLFGLLGVCLVVFVVALFVLPTRWGALWHGATHPWVPPDQGHPMYFFYAVSLFGA